MKLTFTFFTFVWITPIASEITLFGACYNPRTGAHVCHFNSDHCLPAQDYVPETKDYRGRTVPEKPAEPAEIWWTPSEVALRGHICHCDEDSETFAAGNCYDSVTHDVTCHFDASECPLDAEGKPTYWLGNRYTSRVTIDPDGNGEQCTCHDHFDGGPGSATYGLCYDQKTEGYHCALAQHTCEDGEQYYPNHVLKALGGVIVCTCNDVTVGACRDQAYGNTYCAVDGDSCDMGHDFISARQLLIEYPQMDCRLCNGLRE